VTAGNYSKYVYGVNAIGQRTSRAQTGGVFGIGSMDQFTYIGNGELIGSDNDANNALDRGYTYDGIGNRTMSSTGLSSSTTYTPNALNQYSSYQSSGGPVKIPAYDADGNMTYNPSSPSPNFTWNGENRLVEGEWHHRENS